MQRVINDTEQIKEIRLKDIQKDSNDIFAYRCRNSDAYCVLGKFPVEIMMPSRKVNKFGFFPINSSDSSVRFIGGSMHDSIEQVINSNRKVYRFTSMREMLTAMLENRF